MPVNQLDAFNWFFRLALVSLFSWFVFFPFRYFVPDAINKEKQTLFYFGHFVVRAQAICFWNVSMQFISLTARRYINANNTHTHTQTISDRSVWFGWSACVLKVCDSCSVGCAKIWTKSSWQSHWKYAAISADMLIHRYSAMERIYRRAQRNTLRIDLDCNFTRISEIYWSDKN